MATQNKKFTTILLAGLFLGGAIAFGYACGGDDTSPAPIPIVAGSAGMGGSTGTSGNNAGGMGGTLGVGGGGAGGAPGGAAGSAGGTACQASGTFDNNQIKALLAPDGGLPTF